MTLTVNANPGFVFDHWLVNGETVSENPLNVAMDASKEVMAVFTNVLTLVPDPPGGGTITSNPVGINCGNSHVACDQGFPLNAEVVLTANNNTGYELEGWIDGVSGNVLGTGPVYVVTMDGPKIVKAKFNLVGTRNPGYIGLFFGVKDSPGDGGSTTLRGDLSVINVSIAFSNLPNIVQNPVLIVGDRSDGGLGISKEQIMNAIEEVETLNPMPEDTLFLYFAFHGNSLSQGNETTLSEGDECLIIGREVDESDILLTDDDLAEALQNLGCIHKIVVLDACHSGGFWGNNNLGDGSGDLEKLTNITLIAAAPEDQNSRYYSDSSHYQPGTGFLAHALQEGLKSTEFSKWAADTNMDNDLTSSELGIWIQQEFPILDDALCLATPPSDRVCIPYPVPIVFMER